MKKRNILDTPIDFDRTDFFSLLSLSVGASYAWQNAMGALVIGDRSWNVDVRARTINFGEKSFPCGILGSENTQEGTWLWGWANTESNLPEMFIAPSRRAKRTLSAVPEFAAGKFMLDEIHTGHNLAMVSVGASDNNVCYYRCPVDDFLSIFVQIEELPGEVFAPLPLGELMKVYVDVISRFYCDHRLLAAGMLYQNGYEFTVEGAVMTAFAKGSALTLAFEETDGLCRVCDINLESTEQ